MLLNFGCECIALLLLILAQHWTLCRSQELNTTTAMTDPDCYYMAKTRPVDHFMKSKATVILLDGTKKTIPFCRISSGRTCYPEGIETFNFESHLVKHLGAEGIGSKVPVVVNQKVAVDRLHQYQKRFLAFSCEVGQCHVDLCHDEGSNTHDPNRPQIIDLKRLVEDMAADWDIKDLQTQSAFQQLRDICYYVRRTRYAGKGSKDFYPGTSQILWTRNSTEFLEICEMSVNQNCYPRDEEEESHLLEYLIFMQAGRTSLTLEKISKMDIPIKVYDGMYYFYRLETVFKVLNWSCESGSYCNKDRICVPDPNKLPKAPLEFYEFEADLAAMEPNYDYSNAARRFEIPKLIYGQIIPCFWLGVYTGLKHEIHARKM